MLLLAFDLLLLFAALGLAIVLWTDWADDIGLWRLFLGNVKWLVSLTAIWWVVMAIMDGYDLIRAASAPHSIILTVLAVLITVGIYQLVPIVTPPLATRGLSFSFALLSALSVGLWRGIYATLFVQPGFESRALVLGAGRAGRAVAEALRHVPTVGNPYHGSGYHLIGFVDDDASKLGTHIEDVPVLGTSQELLNLIAELSVDEVVLAITHREAMSEQAFDAILACREHGITVVTMAALYERLLGRVPVQHIGRDVQMVWPTEPGPTNRLFWMLKGMADRLIGVMGLFVLVAVTPFIAIANAVLSPGSLFFRQVRVGQGGRAFHVFKFRTMIPDAEKHSGAVWSSRGDPRITPVGKWLRRTRLDELPQFINILKGEMSLIGPRPERPEFVAQLQEQIPFYRMRLAVKPGLTGWAQVRYGYGNSIEDSRIKLEYDLYYVKHAGFYLDVLILLKTLAVVFGLQGT